MSTPIDGGSRRGPRRGLHRLTWEHAVIIALLLVAVVYAVARFTPVDVEVGALGGGGPSGSSTGYPALETPAGGSVEEVAQAHLAAWARPGVGYQRWWRELQPRLTPGARAAYVDTDPRRLPRLGAVRVAEVEPATSPLVATVWFDTELGRFGVDVARRTESAPWRLARVLFPEQDSALT